MTASSKDPTRPWAHDGEGATPYSVTEWGSNPDETDNDDCWTGSDFATLSEARAEMTRLLASATGTAFIMLDGPDAHEVAPVPAYHTPAAKARRAREERAERDAERREYAMEMGMLHGCDGYNEAMGY